MTRGRRRQVLCQGLSTLDQQACEHRHGCAADQHAGRWGERRHARHSDVALDEERMVDDVNDAVGALDVRSEHVDVAVVPEDRVAYGWWGDEGDGISGKRERQRELVEYIR